MAVVRSDAGKPWRLVSFSVAWLAFAWALLNLRMMLIFNVPLGADAGVYWSAWHGPVYGTTASLWIPGFIYSPAAALSFWPLSQLPRTVFVTIWALLGSAAYVWMLKPLPLPARIPAIGAGIVFSINGNIEWVLALVAIFGLRWPSVWLVAVFTKVAPFVGFGWFVFRREWRNVAQAAAIALVLVLATAVILPGAWQTWIRMLWALGSEAQVTNSYNSLMPAVPFSLRALTALVLIWWGARANRPVVLPLALALCQPDWQPWAFGCLAATPRLLGAPALVTEKSTSTNMTVVPDVVPDPASG